MIKFPSIEQFKHIVQQIRKSAEWHQVPTPKIEFFGSVKVHGCVSKNTLVTLADGSQEKIEDLEVGTQILSYNTASHTIEIDEVTDVLSANLEKEWIRLDFSDGNFLECTIDHPILTTDGYVSAGELSA